MGKITCFGYCGDRRNAVTLQRENETTDVDFFTHNNTELP